MDEPDSEVQFRDFFFCHMLSQSTKPDPAFTVKKAEILITIYLIFLPESRFRTQVGRVYTQKLGFFSMTFLEFSPLSPESLVALGFFPGYADQRQGGLPTGVSATSCKTRAALRAK